MADNILQAIANLKRDPTNQDDLQALLLYAEPLRQQQIKDQIYYCPQCKQPMSKHIGHGIADLVICLDCGVSETLQPL